MTSTTTVRVRSYGDEDFLDEHACRAGEGRTFGTVFAMAAGRR